jgi:DNA excision repair protein ERCC-5
MLREELGWNQQKSNDLLLPVIQRINRRGAAVAANKQSNLDAYFGDSIGGVGASAIPRKRQTYTSKRLQKVVTDYREEQKMRSRSTAKRGSSTLLDSDRSEDQYTEELDTVKDIPADFREDVDVGGSDDHGSITGTRKTSDLKTGPTKRKTEGGKRKVRISSKEVTPTASRSAKRKKRVNESDDYEDDEYVDADEAAPAPARPRPKPVRKKANTNSGAGSKTAN